jgi:4-alpha-glucanotransferase
VRVVNGRHAGVMVPLFSIPCERSWGIGEIGDIAPFAAWLRSAGLDLLQILPVNEMIHGVDSPYAAVSAMAIDPIYISMDAVDDFMAGGGEAALDADARRTLATVRAAPRVIYAPIRQLKEQALRLAFSRFESEGWRPDTGRAAAFRAYIDEERWWLDEYALYRALRDRYEARSWTEWPCPLAGRDRAALADARRELAGEILFYQYLQWIADMQWRAARASGGVGLFGDLPFVVGADSADVWACQDEFRLDASVGVPPDAFSETGQDWGLPVYRWDVIARGDYQWLRRRARRMAELFDGYRVDHLVGFYRTYVIPRDGGAPYFVPSDEQAQVAQGERLLEIFAAAGEQIIAEDLGTVPDYVRASLARLGVPGYRVLRWEREWKAPGQPFRDPAQYPAASVATSGTHDTESMADWWDAADADERRARAALDRVAALGPEAALGPFSPAIRDALLETLFASGSDILIVPLGDVFGWRDRINTPATVGDSNWTWRLPWSCNRLESAPEPRERAARLRGWASGYGRG